MTIFYPPKLLKWKKNNNKKKEKKKKKENTKYGEDVEQLEVSCSASRRVNWYNHFEKSFGGKNLTENIYVVHILWLSKSAQLNM